MKYRITLQAEIIVEFDENSEEFKEMFDGYKQAIDRGADYESIAQTVADQVARYGIRQHIEGLGYVKHSGENQDVFHDGKWQEVKGIINVETETDLNGQMEFDIYDSEKMDDDDEGE